VILHDFERRNDRRASIILLTYTVFTYAVDKGRISRLQDTILEHYRRYGPIYRETIAGETVVHLLSPDYVQTVYQNEGKIPHIVPLLETASMYRRLRQMSPGLGHTWVSCCFSSAEPKLTRDCVCLSNHNRSMKLVIPYARTCWWTLITNQIVGQSDLICSFYRSS